MHLRHIVSLAVLAVLLAACGDNAEPVERRQGSTVGPIEGILPRPGGTPDENGGEEVTDTTTVVLSGPILPAGSNLIPLRARLTHDATGNTTILQSTHVARTDQAATAVTAGTYTLTYLDENGRDTNFTERVTLRNDRRNDIAVGGVWVSPASAVVPERQGTESLTYELSSPAEGVLKVVSADLGTLIAVPPVELEWAALGNTLALEPLDLDAGSSLLELEFG